MGYESGNSNSFESESTLEELKVGDDIEAGLIRIFVEKSGIAPDDELQPKIDAWIEDNQETVKTVFADMRREGRNLVEEWNKDPDAVLKEVEDRMSQLVNR